MASTDACHHANNTLLFYYPNTTTPYRLLLDTEGGAVTVRIITKCCHCQDNDTKCPQLVGQHRIITDRSASCQGVS